MSETRNPAKCETAPEITPFKIEVTDGFLDDLKTRLRTTRYPDEIHLPAGEEWSYGTPVNVVKDLVEYWQNDFDWRTVEKRLNTKLPQFMTEIETGDDAQGSLKIHFAHVRSSRPHAIPLLVIHGWPGNFAEVLKMVDELTEPSDPRHPAFHVVAPSIPGFCFSQPPRAPGFGLRSSANVFDRLMKKIGYPHYIAQGGDWGAFIVRALAIWHPDSCRGILSNMFAVHPALLLWHPIMASKLLLGYLGAPGGYNKFEMEGLKRSLQFMTKPQGYSAIQSQKPQKSSVPLGVSIFKEESLQFPDEFGSIVQPLKFVKRHQRGGHFAAWET
ncbi:hypothetical protein FRB99_008861, partial [Tulasnella sp. 403]